MELLIPGLILVALMVYASTKNKKRAAEAFEPETIDNERFTLQKPEGFLHVLDSPDHDFEAYSKESGDDNYQSKRATIDIDVLRNIDLPDAIGRLRNASPDPVTKDEDGSYRIETDEAANETGLKVFYKLVEAHDAVYRLRFAVIAKHVDDYLRRIDETLDSFTVKTAL
jgi:hypothetical protein